jgi:hypothetical protein
VTETNENLYKNLVLRFVSILEDCAIQNLRMKTFILSLPLAQEPDFSLDSLLEETALAVDSERDLRKRYGVARAHLLAASGDQSELRQFLLQIEGTKKSS